MPNVITMKKSEYDKLAAESIRRKYSLTPPPGYSKREIQSMSVNDLLDMDYFLHEDDVFFEDSFVSPLEEPDTIINLIDDYPNELDDPNIPL